MSALGGFAGFGETRLARFGRRRSDYYELRKLDPPYRVYFPTEEVRRRRRITH